MPARALERYRQYSNPALAKNLNGSVRSAWLNTIVHRPGMPAAPESWGNRRRGDDFAKATSIAKAPNRQVHRVSNIAWSTQSRAPCGAMRDRLEQACRSSVDTRALVFQQIIISIAMALELAAQRKCTVQIDRVSTATATIRATSPSNSSSRGSNRGLSEARFSVPSRRRGVISGQWQRLRQPAPRIRVMADGKRVSFRASRIVTGSKVSKAAAAGPSALNSTGVRERVHRYRFMPQFQRPAARVINRQAQIIITILNGRQQPQQPSMSRQGTRTRAIKSNAYKSSSQSAWSEGCGSSTKIGGIAPSKIYYGYPQA